MKKPEHCSGFFFLCNFCNQLSYLILTSKLKAMKKENNLQLSLILLLSFIILALSSCVSLHQACATYAYHDIK